MPECPRCGTEYSSKKLLNEHIRRRTERCFRLEKEKTQATEEAAINIPSFPEYNSALWHVKPVWVGMVSPDRFPLIGNGDFPPHAIANGSTRPSLGSVYIHLSAGTVFQYGTSGWCNIGNIGPGRAIRP